MILKQTGETTPENDGIVCFIAFNGDKCLKFGIEKLNFELRVCF